MKNIPQIQDMVCQCKRCKCYFFPNVLINDLCPDCLQGKPILVSEEDEDF